MRIRHLTLPSVDPDACLAFYRDVMELPVRDHVVTVGWTSFDVVPAETNAGSVHLAFNIPPHRFDAACAWISERALILSTPENQRRFRLQGAWQSESIYFAGPHDSVLELIARDPLAERTVQSAAHDTFHGREIACVSEVGLPTDDVPALVDELTSNFGIPVFDDASAAFVPMGTHEALLIVVDRRRPWFPEQRLTPGALGLSVHLDGVTGRGSFADANGWVLSA